MISLDQILLLEQKVESAVAKIAQLQAENAALRTKCTELSNALSSKSEQLSTIEQDSNMIENGIIKALDRLNSIENSVLNAASQVSSLSTKTPKQSNPTTTPTPVNVSFEQMKSVPATSEPEITENMESEIEETDYSEEPEEEINIPVIQEEEFPEDDFINSEETPSDEEDENDFDIF